MRFLVWLRERRGGAGHIVAVPVSHILKETVRSTTLSPHKRTQPRAVDVPMLQIMEETVELVLVPKEHEQRHTDDRLVDSFVPQSLNDIVEVVSLVPQEHGQLQFCGFSSSSKIGKR